MRMRSIGLVLVLLSLATHCLGEEWRLALPGWRYEFPRDHHTHEGFKTEWWYFTGNLRGKDGAEFGYQLTFFRQGIRPDAPEDARSPFVVRDIALAHFAISDLKTGRYHHRQKLLRADGSEAGFSAGNRLAWTRGWWLELRGDGRFALHADDNDFALQLELLSEKPPVFHGSDGISRKAEGEGRASHYYSFTRLRTTGTLTLDGREQAVEGWSWYDHEWATNQLAATQTGWDWFSLQFEDGTDLMLFQIRTTGGGRDPYSSGTWVERDGTTRPIKNSDFELTAAEWWRSRETGGEYPIAWNISIPKLQLDLHVRARQPAQEFVAEPISYWEGAVEAKGTRDGQPVAARGYLEMTGYAGEVVGMQASD